MHCTSPPTKEGLEGRQIVVAVAESSGVVAKENGRAVAKSHNNSSSNQSRRE